MAEPKPAVFALDDLGHLAPDPGTNLRVFPPEEPPEPDAAPPRERARRRAGWLDGGAGLARRKPGRHRRPDPGARAG